MPGPSRCGYKPRHTGGLGSCRDSGGGHVDTSSASECERAGLVVAVFPNWRVVLMPVYAVSFFV